MHGKHSPPPLAAMQAGLCSSSQPARALLVVRLGARMALEQVRAVRQQKEDAHKAGMRGCQPVPVKVLQKNCERSGSMEEKGRGWGAGLELERGPRPVRPSADTYVGMVESNADLEGTREHLDNHDQQRRPLPAVHRIHFVPSREMMRRTGAAEDEYKLPTSLLPSRCQYKLT